MLIELEIENFKSIKERVSFSMLPSNKFSENRNITTLKNIGKTDEYYLLNSAIIYGANAAGKSNILRAFKALQYLVDNSVDYKLDDEIEPYEPYLLDKGSKNKPVYLKSTFIGKDKIIYEYEIKFNSKEIVIENLYFYPKNQKARLFERTIDDLKFGDYFTGIKNFNLLKNQLLLSHVGKTGTKSLLNAYKFFTKYLFAIIVNDMSADFSRIRFIGNYVNENDKIRSDINKLLRHIGTQLEGITVVETDQSKFDYLPDNMPEKVKNEIKETYKFDIKARHKVYEDGKEIGYVDFDLLDESAGTVKFLSISSVILDALQDGSTVIVDELDKSLHPLLTRILVSLFNQKETNPNGAQLIFASHDVTLIDKELLRLDQIWFVNKSTYGNTDLYPLSDFKGISKIKTLRQWYLEGRFGGIPEIIYPVIQLESCNEKI